MDGAVCCMLLRIDSVLLVVVKTVGVNGKQDTGKRFPLMIDFAFKEYPIAVFWRIRVLALKAAFEWVKLNGETKWCSGCAAWLSSDAGNLRTPGGVSSR